MLCDVRFTVLKRRHHCRACGKVREIRGGKTKCFAFCLSRQSICKLVSKIIIKLNHLACVRSSVYKSVCLSPQLYFAGIVQQMLQYEISIRVSGKHRFPRLRPVSSCAHER